MKVEARPVRDDAERRRQRKLAARREGATCYRWQQHHQQTATAAAAAAHHTTRRHQMTTHRRRHGDDDTYDASQQQRAEHMCWLDALPLDVLHSHVALRDVCVMTALAFAYPPYARHCRRIYASLPEDAWRQFAVTVITDADGEIKQPRRKRQSCRLVTLIPLPAQHPLLLLLLRCALSLAAVQDLVYRRASSTTGALQRYHGDASVSDNNDNVDSSVSWVAHSLQGGAMQPADAPPALVAHAVEGVIIAKQRWYRYGLLHRDADLPASIDHDKGLCKWFRDGKLHRDNGLPAWIGGNGQGWYRNGVLHRDSDLPVYISNNGDSSYREWYRDGKLHRDGDKPAIIESDNTQEWYRDGELHRDGDLPAVINNTGWQEWWRNGEMYRNAIDAGIVT